MKLEIFTIYDVVSHVYNQPFYLINKGAAIRQFDNMCNDDETQISLNPADYTLYHLGSFDNTTCKIIQKDPVSLGNGVQFIKIQTEETADT
jgi:hypothetical protein